MTTGTIKSVLTEKQEEAKSAKKEWKVKKRLEPKHITRRSATRKINQDSNPWHKIHNEDPKLKNPTIKSMYENQAQDSETNGPKLETCGMKELHTLHTQIFLKCNKSLKHASTVFV